MSVSIPFITVDNEIFFVEKNIAFVSGPSVLSNIANEANIYHGMAPIPISVMSKPFEKILHYLTDYFNELCDIYGNKQIMPQEGESEEEQQTYRKVARFERLDQREGFFRDWELKFFQMDSDKLYEVIEAAGILQIKSIITSNCIILSHMINVVPMKCYVPYEINAKL